MSRRLTLALLFLLLAACGQTGPLTLPGSAPDTAGAQGEEEDDD